MATSTYWQAPYPRNPRDEELEAMDPVDVALALYSNDSSYDRIRQSLWAPMRYLPPYDDPTPPIRRRRRSPSPPPPQPRKRACIAASTNAILGLKEVVLTAATVDDHCAICLKDLAIDQEDAIADDDDDDQLKALLALATVGRQDAHQEEEEEEEDDDDDAADDVKKKATVTWTIARLRPPRLRAMPCSHVFHQYCIFKWLSSNAVCPLCRHKLPTIDDDE